ncbi:MAG TPA: mannitol dehydrogenase family protein [Geminicoccaceae bacterium]|nr:mannitol dehydrogenase family protein [Geminicoccaceae bacterium]
MRLSERTLTQLPPEVARPGYDRRAVRPGIVHLGIGAFHRAHQAVYTEALLARGDPRWGIVGASLRSPATRDALAPQDGLYAGRVRDTDGASVRVVGAVLDLLVAPDNPEALVARIADPATRLVTLTVTEKGYCHDPAPGHLDGGRPDVRHDLEHPAGPRTAIGFVVAGLERRRRAGLPPLTVLSCDNLPSNGRTLRRIVLDFADAKGDPDLRRWIEAEVAFPSSMVDRIVPATTDDDRRDVAGLLGGVEDAWPVVTEPFRQWVVEDRFAGERPAWEEDGATFVASVEPFEHMKLRLLNGAHSAIAYLSVAAGVETVSDAMALPGMRGFLRALWAESGETLDLPAGYDLAGYVGALERRFENTALRHRTGQIAMDGSQKLPQRLLEPIRERLAAGRPVPILAAAVAAWMRHVRGTGEDGAPIPLDDPLADELHRAAGGAGNGAAALVRSLALVEAVFSSDLGRDPRFVEAVKRALAVLDEQGTRGFLARFA